MIPPLLASSPDHQPILQRRQRQRNDKFEDLPGNSDTVTGVLVSTLARQPLAVGRHEHGVALCYLLMLRSPGSIAYVEANHHRWHEDLPC
ncbi:hypothetical protein K1719_011115 [Acacia pycnantha]|nr:hypothetical protein K1719_011115 [Acacia pycnantha]